MASEIKLETAKFDARFPNTNQTKNCWTNYRDFQRCVKARGEDYEPCEWFKKTYMSLCPMSWVSLGATGDVWQLCCCVGGGVGRAGRRRDICWQDITSYCPNYYLHLVVLL